VEIWIKGKLCEHGLKTKLDNWRWTEIMDFT